MFKYLFCENSDKIKHTIIIMTFTSFLFAFNGEVETGTINLTSGYCNELKCWILENDYVRVDVLPEASGRITRYLYKPGDFNHFVDYEERATPPLIARTVRPLEHNSGGLSDHRWETGHNRHEKIHYDVKETKENSIMLKRPGGTVRKNILIEKGSSTVVTMRINVSNKGEEPYSYLAHGLIRSDLSESALRGNYQVIPLGPSLPDSERLNSSSVRRNIRKIDSEEVLWEEMYADTRKHYFSPAQPWLGVVDSHEKLITGVLVEPAGIIEEGLLFCREGGRGDTIMENVQDVEIEYRITQEVIFPPVNPGKEREFILRLVTIEGLEKLSYLNKDMGLLLEGVGEAGKNNSFTVKVAPSREMQDASVIIILVSDEEKLYENIEISMLQPGDIFSHEINLPPGLPPGEYRIYGETNLDGVKDEFRFIGSRLIL